MSLKSFIKNNLLPVLTLGSVFLGIVIGIIVRRTYGKFDERHVAYVNYPGELLLRMLRCLIIPLVTSSLISAVGKLDLEMSKKIGRRAIGYYMATTILAVILGTVLVVTIQPGASQSEEIQEENDSYQKKITTPDSFMDLLRNLFPPNLVQACTEQYQTVLTQPKDGNETDITKLHMGGEFVKGTNILGLVMASVILGIAISSSKVQSLILLNFFDELSFLSMKITAWVIWLSPVGVMFLIIAKIMEMDDLSEIFGKLGYYIVTVLGGLLLHGFVVLPLIYFLLTRKNPYVFLMGITEVLATAFGTSSSSATLPITIKCLEQHNNVDQRITRFVLPIGATINMDGTALYEAVAAIFISQLRNVDLTFGNIIAISITATAASIGAAGIPQAGLVTIVMVLDVLGLPAEDASLILAVDWLLDRFRTMINVVGDSLGAGILQDFLQKEQYKLEQADRNNSTFAMSTCAP